MSDRSETAVDRFFERRVRRFAAWAVVFKDGEPMHLTISRCRKSSIALAREYFGEEWHALKWRGMRCVEISIETPNVK